MKTENIDKDKIDSNVKLVREYEGAQLFHIGILDLVVLNGTHKEMGQQYGGLLKDKILATTRHLEEDLHRFWETLIRKHSEGDWQTILYLRTKNIERFLSRNC